MTSRSRFENAAFRRTSFYVALLGTAMVMFLTERVEYAGLEYLQIAGALTACTVAGTAALLLLAVFVFLYAGASEVLLACGCIATCPFLVAWLLYICGTELNMNGYAMFGYFAYLFGSELCAIGLLVAVAIRTFLRLKASRAA
jgi:hypothetical protein